MLPKVIVEELRKRASRIGATIEEYLFDILMKNSNPLESAEKYLKGARELLNQAKEELSKNDLR